MSDVTRTRLLASQQAFCNEPFVFHRERFSRVHCIHQCSCLCKAEPPDKFGLADFIRNMPDQLLQFNITVVSQKSIPHLHKQVIGFENRLEVYPQK